MCLPGRFFSRDLVVRLAVNFIEQKLPPHTSGGVLLNAYSYFFSGNRGGGSTKLASEGQSQSILARKSAMLLLILVHQVTSNQKPNDFRVFLTNLSDSDGLFWQIVN